MQIAFLRCMAIWLRHRYAWAFLVLHVTSLHAAPMELDLEQLKKDLGFAVKEMTVIEPHKRCDGCEFTVTYVGIPFRKLIEYYYHEEWNGFSGDIHLIARDGYLGHL